MLEEVLEYQLLSVEFMDLNQLGSVELIKEIR